MTLNLKLTQPLKLTLSPGDFKLPSIIIRIPGYRLDSSCSKISRPRAILHFIPSYSLFHPSLHPDLFFIPYCSSFRPIFYSILQFIPSYSLFHPTLHLFRFFILSYSSSRPIIYSILLFVPSQSLFHPTLYPVLFFSSAYPSSRQIL